ncbi:pyridoxamine 5'-phosphate oxidase family protein [Patescibacteria group bacterium]|nr:pyridoxamine 5'-phosphate oxidase family protein [Patescibacteria group bacterium]
MNTSTERIITAIKDLGQNLGVISTVGADGKPESAVVYFSCDENLDLYFTTRNSSRKYKNLSTNPAIAFVIYEDKQKKTIQIEGTAETITDTHDQGAMFSELVSLATKNNPTPPIDQLGESEIMFIRITVTWARIGNFEITRTGELFEEVTI